MPMISVIVPVYKAEKYLCRCIDSILGQTFQDFELILVDDGSPDSSGRICDDYALQDDRIVVIHQENRGVSAARNAGLDWMYANSNSQWMTFVDSDDWIHPEMLEQLLNINLEFGTEISACEYQRTDGTIIEVDYSGKKPLLYAAEEFFEKYGWIAGYLWGKLYRRKCFEQIRFPVGKCYEDVFIAHRILFAQKHIAMVWVSYYFYYINPESITQKVWSKQRLDYFEAMKERILFFEEIGCKKLVQNNISAYVTLCFRQLGQTSFLPNRSKRREVRKIIYRELNWGLNCCIKEKVFPRIPIDGYIQWIKKRIRLAKNQFFYRKIDFPGAGNNPMVGMTAHLAVAVEKSQK